MKQTGADRRTLVMVGAGGHAKVLHALALAAGHIIVGVCDPQLAEQGVSHWRGVAVLGDDEAIERLDPAAVGLINGVGQVVGSALRQTVYARLRRAGFCFPALLHPTAWVASCATLGQGVQVMAGAVIQPDCRIGENSIINTRAGVDHDCEIGAHVHIAPAATLCGSVRILDGAFVGAGATVIQGLVVAEGATVGAGVTLLRNLGAQQIARGKETPPLRISHV